MSVTNTRFASPRPRTHRGFTLTEILVTIGIIVILIAITVPTVGRMRTAAHVAGAQAQLNGLQGAITRYQQDHGAFPGPLTNDELRRTPFQGFQDPATTPNGFAIGLRAPNSYNITGTENLVLGLLGGLVRQGAGAASEIAYDPSVVGSGPNNLNVAQPKKFPAYVEAANLSWREVGGLKTGDYADGAGDAIDSIVPEFVDTFPSPMPVLYLRANRGAVKPAANAATPQDNFVVSNPSGNTTARTGQYDFSQFSGYVGADLQGNFIGEGKRIDPNAYVGKNWARPIKPAQLPHGLTAPSPASSMDKANADYQYPFNAYAYLKNPSSSTTDPEPRQKDGYILISAGADRVYGTADDITSFGSVTE